MYKHYIEINKDNYITKAFSDAFEAPTKHSICINNNGSRHFNLDLHNQYGLCKQWINKKIINATPTTSAVITEIITAIKSEAKKRILTKYPSWKQQNIGRELALYNTLENQQVAQACSNYIANIQTISNKLENKVNKMTTKQLIIFNPNMEELWN